MNKKEIAQQFTRQMLGQEASGQDEQPMPTNEEKMLAMLKAVELLYSNALASCGKNWNREMERALAKVREADTLATNEAYQVRIIVSAAQDMAKAHSKVGSRWVIRVYLIAILSAICSALVTLVVVWLLWN
jgi:membrane-bound ClpP family serine protease